MEHKRKKPRYLIWYWELIQFDVCIFHNEGNNSGKDKKISNTDKYIKKLINFVSVIFVRTLLEKNEVHDLKATHKNTIFLEKKKANWGLIFLWNDWLNYCSIN